MGAMLSYIARMLAVNSQQFVFTVNKLVTVLNKYGTIPCKLQTLHQSCLPALTSHQLFAESHEANEVSFEAKVSRN